MVELASMPALKCLWINSDYFFELARNTIKKKNFQMYQAHGRIEEKGGTNGIWEIPTRMEHLDLFELTFPKQFYTNKM